MAILEDYSSRYYFEVLLMRGFLQVKKNKGAWNLFNWKNLLQIFVIWLLQKRGFSLYHGTIYSDALPV